MEERGLNISTKKTFYQSFGFMSATKLGELLNERRST